MAAQETGWFVFKLSWVVFHSPATLNDVLSLFIAVYWIKVKVLVWSLIIELGL